MTSTRYDLRALQEYREKVAETVKLRAEVESLATGSHTSGDLGPAENMLQELTLKTKELGDLRQALGPEGLFLIKYGYQKIDDHTVSFVLPKGCSRYEILQEAQDLVSDRSLLNTWMVKFWAIDSRFTCRTLSSERLCIRGYVKGGIGKTSEQQDELLKSKGLELPSLEDLAVAFALHWVATKDSLLGWSKSFYDKPREASNLIRTSHDSLGFDSKGLMAFTRHAAVGLAARIPYGPAAEKGLVDLASDNSGFLERLRRLFGFK